MPWDLIYCSMSKRAKKTLLTDQFKQRYQKKHSQSLARVLLFVAGFLTTALALLLLFLFSPLRSWQMAHFQLPNIPWPYEQMTRLTASITTRNDVLILRSKPIPSSETEALYLACDCLPETLKKTHIIAFLKQYDYPYTEQSVVRNNQACQEMVIGPLNDYTTLYRIQSFFNYLKLNTTTTSRR